MLRVLKFIKPYRIAVFIALALMLTELFVELFHPLLMAKIIDDGILQGDLSVVMKWGGIMVGLSFVAFAAGIINSFFAAHVSQSFGFDIRRAMYEKIQSFSFANFNFFPTSSLITRMTNDVTQIQNTVFMSLRIMLRAPLLVIGGVIMALFVNFRLALFVLIAVPFLFFFLVWVMRKGSGLFTAVQQKVDGVNNVMRENLGGIRLIRAFLRHDHESKRFTKASGELQDKTVRALRLMEIAMPILLLVMNLTIIAVLWFGNIGVQNNNARVGEIVAIVNYVTRITGALSILSFIIMAFSRAKASSTRLAEVLEEEIDLVDIEQAKEMETVDPPHIEFDAVSFRYPGTNTTVIEDISFEVKPGETVAILGSTGSGKSSLFQLLPRLYDVDEGAIYIDGQDIKQLKLAYLRRLIGYVPQESLLFTGTVSDNLSWGKENATMEEMIEATKAAQIHDTIERLPKGYETRLGQKGINLSGGQKQRLSIARALIRKPKILMMDDSTSALDLKTEGKLLQALKKYECTTFIITQKVSTATEADKILLMDDGMLLEQGTHESLLKESSLYQKIYESQFGEEVSYAKTAK
ncbi:MULTISPECIES: ABC transporter ATP-binding protein [Sutcliffiella]|uniref:ABC transporter ATP-binding protein n=1 Tax=Sutcliffiella cohnii TaxID=33932 RepID=A0A223KKQ5_9BACI|nr:MULTISPECIES: ABC transporter ATP-binding protein [Sutcliffiella]AST89948.1 ABC transporter ATP-binding protein [Sutcliffiella cohnii]WBL15572.1 ABC transporter ATP-binding protein [Sutcliffiella sp. NC1]